MKQPMVALVAVALATLVGGTGPTLAEGQTRSAASPGSLRIDVSTLGPQVGERVPDFTLSDHTGEAHSLQSIMGPNGAMLVFVRSADW